MNIAGRVEEALKTRGIREGLCLMDALHITASGFFTD